MQEQWRRWLFCADWIDQLNQLVGRSVSWLLLLAVMIGAGNAMVRKIWSLSSNAFLEVQWYLFAAVFLLAAGYTLQQNEHVRIDIFLSRCSQRTQVVVELIGTILFLWPFTALTLYFSWPYFLVAWYSWEFSPNAGGLITWPAKLLIPIGFFLLFLQGVAQVTRAVCKLYGLRQN